MLNLSTPSPVSCDPGKAAFNPESCQQLFFAVIRLAIRDAELIKRVGRKGEPTAYEEKTVGQVTAVSHPEDFFDSDWFEEICAMLCVLPETIRERL